MGKNLYFRNAKAGLGKLFVQYEIIYRIARKFGGLLYNRQTKTYLVYVCTYV